VTWKPTRLKYLAAAPIVNGVGEPGAFDNPAWPRYVRTTDIASPTELRDDTFASLPPKTAARAPLERHDIVMTAAGTIGKSFRYELEEPACYAGYLVRFRARADVDPRFISYWTESTTYWDQIVVGRVVSTIENFSASKYQNLRLRCPDFETQRTIADYLDAETSRIDALIAKKRRMIELLNERWQSTMAEGISGEVLGLPQASPTGISWLPTMSAGWRRAKLNLIARLGSGHTPSRQHPEWWEDPTIPWITTGEVSQVRDDRREYLTETREKISEIGLANSAAELHPADTVVLCRTASAGYSAIMGTNMATSQDFATWTCGPLLRPRFLLLCLRVMRQDLLGRLAMGSTHKTIYMPDIESIVVPLPSVEVQDAVVEAVYSRLPAIDASIDRLTRQIDLLVEHRQALITAAVTGEIDVPGAAA
jgi:type I restriction enzyme S subunit